MTIKYILLRKIVFGQDLISQEVISSGSLIFVSLIIFGDIGMNQIVLKPILQETQYFLITYF